MVADALNRWKHFITTMTVIVPGSKQIKQEYEDDKDFSTIYSNHLNSDQEKHTLQHTRWVLFRDSKLCLTATSIQEHVVRESHSGDWSVHFGSNKTLALVDYWPCMKINVISICKRCSACQLAKRNKKNTELYQLLPISHAQ